jgi:hypothetical protein
MAIPNIMLKRHAFRVIVLEPFVRSCLALENFEMVAVPNVLLVST